MCSSGTHCLYARKVNFHLYSHDLIKVGGSLQILEEKLGEIVVEEGLTRSGQKMEKLICFKEKGQGGETDVSTGNSGAVQERT